MENDQKLIELITSKVDTLNEKYNSTYANSIIDFKRKIFNTLENCYTLTSEKEMLICEQEPLGTLEHYYTQSSFIWEVALNKLHSCVKTRSLPYNDQSIEECIKTNNIEKKYTDSMNKLMEVFSQGVNNNKIQ